MKKIILLLICVLFLTSCGETSISDRVTDALATESTLPAGRLMFYGKFIENSMSRETLSDYLGLEGYPDFAEKIEEMAVYSSLIGDYAEVCVLRVYDHDAVADAKKLLTRRITDAKRALTVMQKNGYADTAFVYAEGNTVALFMLPDNETVKKKIF